MQDEYKVKRLREMLETTETTGFSATVRHQCNPGAGILNLDAAALRVLIAHYSMPEPEPRPAWLEPETIDAPRPVRGLAVERE